MKMKEQKNTLVLMHQGVVSIEVPAGGMIKLNEEWLKCVANKGRWMGCERCYLYGKDLCMRMLCDDDVRKDGLDVYFENVDEKGGEE